MSYFRHEAYVVIYADEVLDFKNLIAKTARKNTASSRDKHDCAFSPCMRHRQRGADGFRAPGARGAGLHALQSMFQMARLPKRLVADWLAIGIIDFSRGSRPWSRPGSRGSGAELARAGPGAGRSTVPARATGGPELRAAVRADVPAPEWHRDAGRGPSEPRNEQRPRKSDSPRHLVRLQSLGRFIVDRHGQFPE